MSKDHPSDKVSADRDLLYAEYVRLSERVDALSKQSFGDFRLLSVIGASTALLIKLYPLIDGHIAHSTSPSTANASTTEAHQFAPVVAFTMLALVAIIAFRDLMVQSMAYGLVPHLQTLETEIRNRSGLDGTGAFRVNESLPKWHEVHKRAVKSFGFVFFVAVIAIPTWALVDVGVWAYAIAYFVACVIVFVAYERLGSSLIADVIALRPDVVAEGSPPRSASGVGER